MKVQLAGYLVLGLSMGLWGCVDPELVEAQDRLRINEFMASNAWTLADERGEFVDWIEIFNPNDEEVTLDGLSISDDFEEPDKHRFGELSVPGNGFLILWAVGGDEDLGETYLNFKLSKNGEAIGLFDRRGDPSDQLEYGPQVTDFSAALVEDGGEEWVIDSMPTPGESNQ